MSRVMCVGLLIAAAQIFSPAQMYAQSASVRGLVIDSVSGRPLAQANVRLTRVRAADGGPAHGAVTDAQGIFRIGDLPQGAYALAVSYLGYGMARRSLTLSAGENRRVRVALAPRAVSMEEIVVSGEDRLMEGTRELGLVELSARDLREIPAVLEPDIFRSLQLLPGVKAASDYSSGLYIRGGGPGQTLVLLDRAPVYSPSHFFGFFSTFNPAAIGDVALYKGGYPAKYGGRLGAVVALENRSGGRSETSGMVSGGLLASRAAVSGPLPGAVAGGSYMFAIRRSTLEPLLAALNDLEVDGIPKSFYFYDINGRMDVDLSSTDRLNMSLYTGSDAIALDLFDDDAEITLTYGNHVGQATWTHLMSNDLFTRLTATTSHYASNPRFAVAETAFEQQLQLRDYTARGQVLWTPGRRHELEAGFRSGYFSFEYGQSFNERQTYSPEVQSIFADVYLQDTYRPSSRWEITGGLRMNYFVAGRHLRLSPRLSAAFHPRANFRLQAGYGRYHQFLSLNTLGGFSGFDIWLTTGGGVAPSWGDQFVTGVNWQLHPLLNLDVEGYFRTMRDLFRQDPFLADPAGMPYADLFQFGEGRAYGMEIMLQKGGGPLNGFVAYTLSRTQRRFDQLNDGTFYSPKYDRTHDLNVVLNYDVSSTWRFTSVFTYATGQAYTRPVSQYRLLNPPFQSTPYNLLEAPFNNERLPPYHRLDLGVRNRGSFFGFADYELMLQVINIYSRRNIWFYNFSFTEENIVERDIAPQIPVPLPNLVFTLRF